MQTPKVLGILGGLGPMATAKFYELLIKHTKAECDQDHIDLIINSRATTPDRTGYILGQSNQNPFDIMADDAHRLVTFGADMLAIPCNTAHFFYERLEKTVGIPILNMPREAVLWANEQGAHKLGILATTGTIKTETYQRVCREHNMAFAIPCESAQEAVMNIIYNNIKKGESADMNSFNKVCEELFDGGCDRLVLACTELSLIKYDHKLGEKYIDSMQALAKAAIQAFGKTAIGF